MALGLRSIKAENPGPQLTEAEKIARLEAQIAQIKQTLPETPAPVAPLTAEERAALRHELDRRQAAAEMDAKRRHDADRDKEFVLAQWDRVYAETDVNHFGTFVEDMRRDAWARRYPEVDALIAKYTAEADALVVDSTAVPRVTPVEDVSLQVFNGGEIADRTMQRFSNVETVAARRAGLREIARLIRRWTEDCMYADVPELLQMVKAEYAKLPAIEPVRTVAARLGTGWARKFLGLSTPQDAA